MLGTAKFRISRCAIEGFLAELTQDQREAMEAEFVAKNQENSFLIQRYRKHGMDSAAVQGCFAAFIFKEKISAKERIHA